jgi:transcriptional regulator with XRE-family HTH domain
MAGTSLLGFEIKKLRSMRGMSQDDLANAVGTSVTSISGIETGRHKPRQALLTKLAEILHVPTERLKALAEGIEPPEITQTKSGTLLRTVDFDEPVSRVDVDTNNAEFICSLVTEHRTLHSTGEKKDILDFLNWKLSTNALSVNDFVLIQSNSSKGLPDVNIIQKIRLLLQTDTNED